MKKYEFTGETKLHFGVTLHRIRATIDFGIVKKGEIGGWIEKESNLADDGNAWVSGDARVYGNACYMAIGPIGSRNDTITFTRDKRGDIFAAVGCFFGLIAKFRKKVAETHGENHHAKAYLA